MRTAERGPPATVANAQKNRARGIIARCPCDHEALPSFGRLDLSWFVPAIALRLWCLACGGKRVEMHPDWLGRGP